MLTYIEITERNAQLVNKLSSLYVRRQTNTVAHELAREIEFQAGPQFYHVISDCIADHIHSKIR